MPRESVGETPGGADGIKPRGSTDQGRWVALSLLFAGAFLRCPTILLHGRIWAEESNVFLVTSWNQPFLKVLHAAHFGYFSLWDNLLADVATHWVPLEFAALLFTWSGVLILLVTGWLVYEMEVLATRTAKTVGVLALLFCSPSFEVWVNLINSEFFFGIWAAVILVSDANRLRAQRTLALLVAGLCGPLTTLLAPLYVVRAVLHRRRDEVIQAIAVVSMGSIQLGVAAVTSMANRKVHLSPLTVGPILFNKELVLLFLNRSVAKASYGFFSNHLHFSLWTLLALSVAFVAGYGGLIGVARRQRAAIVLLGIALWLAVVEAVLALNGGLEQLQPGMGERYAYAPNFLIELALLVVATAGVAGAGRAVARGLLGAALLSGLADYAALDLRAKPDYQGIPWRQQVLRWRQDPSIALQPLPTWWESFHLPPKR